MTTIGDGGLNLERLLVASRRLGSRKKISDFGWEKNKLVSKYQTQAVEPKNAIKNHQKSPRPSETCLTFGQIFLDSPLESTLVPVLLHLLAPVRHSKTHINPY